MMYKIFKKYYFPEQMECGNYYSTTQNPFHYKITTFDICMGTTVKF